MGAARTRRVRRLLRPVVIVPAVVVLTLAVVSALAVFQPWKLWVDDVVNESFPVATGSSSPVPSLPATEGTTATSTATAVPEVIARGAFISHEHATSGSARVVRLTDGSRVLRIDDLDTSNGPDLRVWLAAAPVKEGRSGWYVFDDDDHVELGRLKGNIGDQNYVIPSSVDLDRLTSVAIWCDRFNVSFGAAALT